MDQIYLIAMNIKANVTQMLAVAGLEDTPQNRLICMKRLLEIATTVDMLPLSFIELYLEVMTVMVEEQIAQIAIQN